MSRFGDDEHDHRLSRWLDLRFHWNREDGLLGIALLTPMWFPYSVHTRPFRRLTRVFVASLRDGELPETGQEAGIPLPLPASKEEVASERLPGRIAQLPGGQPIAVYSGHPKHSTPKTVYDYHGVEACPSLVLDCTLGPLLTSSVCPELSWRWSARYRQASEAAEVVRLHQELSAQAALPLAFSPRTLSLLLKAVASSECEHPSVSVGLGIAIGEHFRAYNAVERLEVLRGLRRVAMVRASSGQQQLTEQLYLNTFSEAWSASRECLAAYVNDVCLTMRDRVWATIEEDAAWFLTRGLYLDWLDRLSLSMQVLVPSQRGALENAVRTLEMSSSSSPSTPLLSQLWPTLSTSLPVIPEGREGLKGYALLRYNLQMSESTIRLMLGWLSASSQAEPAPLLLWRCVSLIVMLVAEAVGGVLRHTSQLLERMVQLAVELEDLPGSYRYAPSYPHLKEAAMHAMGSRSSSDSYYQLQGSQQSRRVRQRLLPFKAFERIYQCFHTPFFSAVGPAWQPSPLGAVLAENKEVEAELERVTAALQWGSALLRLVLTYGPTSAALLPPPASVPASSSCPEMRKASVPESTTDAADSRQRLVAHYNQVIIRREVESLLTSIDWGTAATTATATEGKSDGEGSGSGESFEVGLEAVLHAPQPEPPALAASATEKRLQAHITALEKEVRGLEEVVLTVLQRMDDCFGPPPLPCATTEQERHPSVSAPQPPLEGGDAVMEE